MSEAKSQNQMESDWASKEIKLDEIASKIANGSSLYIGSCACTPEATLEALVDDYRLADIQIIQMIPGGNLPHLSENLDRFRTSSFYSFDTKAGFFDAEEGVASQREGLKDVTPVGINQVSRLLEEGKLKVDVALRKYCHLVLYCTVQEMLEQSNNKHSRTPICVCVLFHIIVYLRIYFS
jgi:acyl-CoA hydrolase